MKTMALLILMLCLLQPVACFAYPCDSSLGAPDTVDSSGKSGCPSHNQDADSCDSTVCCAEFTHLNDGISVAYAPLVSLLVTPEKYQKLPKVIIPIFVPPQSRT